MAAGYTLRVGAARCTLTVGAAGCTLKIGAAGCTLTVGAAGRGLVGAGGMLGLCPHGSRYVPVDRASPLRFALRPHGLGFTLSIIK